ncbi:MAG TPA: alpha/beta fold hydrolase [Dehalococcoidia bacterium]|nr:alpha/beta fold hydrolase [Dehalococcoidia bacterium]
MDGLSGRFRLVQYDIRTQGASRPRTDADFSIAGHGHDLEAVVDHLQLDRFVLLAWSGFGHVAVRYAIANPDRVEALILGCCPVSGGSWPRAMFAELVEEDWEVFIRSQIPPGLSEEARATELQLVRQSATQEASTAGMRVALESNLEDVLPSLRVPTMVVHPRDYLTLRPEESMKLAASIREARMVLIDGSDVLGDSVQGLAAIEAFLNDVLPRAEQARPVESSTILAYGLSQRQRQVLQLIAQGKTNREIAEELVLSERTVQRHIADLYLKINVRNRAEATSFAMSRLA